MKKLSFLLLISLLTIGLLAACGNKDDEGKGNTNNNDNVELPEPTLDDIPEIVAEVNGEEITKEEFEEVYLVEFQGQAMYAQMSGVEIDEDELKQIILNSMIEQKLFFQEADVRIPEPSEEGIEDLFEKLMADTGVESKEELIQMYEENGVTEDELMENIHLQVRVNELVKDEVGDIVVDEDEARETYDQLVKEQEEANKDVEDPQEIPAFEDVKDMITQSLQQEKEVEALQEIIDGLMENADIKLYI